MQNVPVHSTVAYKGHTITVYDYDVFIAVVNNQTAGVCDTPLDAVYAGKVFIEEMLGRNAAR